MCRPYAYLPETTESRTMSYRRIPLILLVVIIFLQAVPASAHTIASPLETTAYDSVFAHTVTLLALALVIGGAGFGVFVWQPAHENRVPRHFSALWGVLAVGGILLFVISLNRPLPTVGAPLLAFVSRWLHSLAALLWAGSLAFLLAAWLREPPPDIRQRMMVSFIPLTRLCIAAVALTGIYSAWLYVGSVAGLLTTAYGQALIAKTVLFAVLFQVSMLNPRQAARVLTVEAALLAVVLGSTGIMRSVDPARYVIDWYADQALHANSPAVFEPILLPDYQIDLSVLPGAAGNNTLYITVFDSQTGVRLDHASEVRLLLTYADAARPQGEVVLLSQGDGVYSAPTESLDTAGGWNAQAVIQFPDRGGVTASFDFRIAPPIPVFTVDPGVGIIQAVLAIGVGLLLMVVGGMSILQKGKIAAPQALAWVVAIVGVVLTVAAAQNWIVLNL